MASVQLGTPAGAETEPKITLTPVGTYESGQFDESAAEIVAHDPQTQRLFVVNAEKGAVDVLDIEDPTTPVLVETLEAVGGDVNSVDVSDGVIAIAVEAPVTQDPGTVEIYDAMSLELMSTVPVGALPDMLSFTPDGSKIVVANEGEPDHYCADGEGDPEGSISVIDLSVGAGEPSVATADFTAFNDDIDDLRDAGVRIFGPNATVAQDLEPEYVAIDPDSTTAWVSLQENNAFAIVDLDTATVTEILPLGYKDHSLPGHGFDASNRDDVIDIRNWPVLGAYMPDGIDAYEHGDQTYVVTANEGDARDYDCYSEEDRIADIDLDPTAFPEAAGLQEDENLGRLHTSRAFYRDDLALEDGEYEDVTAPATELYSFGARSFSIFDADGNLVFDSGDDFEQITATLIPEHFNANNDENGSFDARSDDKGPEPEDVEVARVFSRTYAFIGLERVGGIMVYDISDPHEPKFVEYVTNRDFGGDAEAGTAGDLGPEGITFIAPQDSPTGDALLAVGNEVSGTTTIFRIDEIGGGGGQDPEQPDDGEDDYVTPEGITAACDGLDGTASFPDIDGNVHEAAIRCQAAWSVAFGFSDGTFRPSAPVTRAQMASFVIRVLAEAGLDVPESPPDAFDDDAASTHEPAINRAAALGIVEGVGVRRFDPNASVSRAQAASMIVAAYEVLTGVELPTGPTSFGDIGGIHRDAIETAFHAGFVKGVSSDQFASTQAVTRSQMASLVMRFASALVVNGHGSRPA